MQQADRLRDRQKPIGSYNEWKGTKLMEKRVEKFFKTINSISYYYLLVVIGPCPARQFPSLNSGKTT